MEIYESAEDYLEAILILQKRNGTVRSVDIAAELGFSKPSVSVAMKKLRENGLVTVSSDGSISLLNEGRKIAENIYERHQFFTSFFIHIGIDPETARHDACRIEHDLSESTFRKMKDALTAYMNEN